MKKETLEYFKRFMHTRGLAKLFEGMYKQYHFDDNPVKVETYLNMVNPFLVVVLAFDFNKLKTTAYNEKFWLNIHNKWVNELLLLAGITTDKFEIKIEELICQEVKAISNYTNAIETKQVTLFDDEMVEVVREKRYNKPRKRRARPIEHDTQFRIDSYQMRIVFSMGYSIAIKQSFAKPSLSLCKQDGKLFFRISNNERFAMNQYSVKQICVNARELKNELEKYFGFNFNNESIYSEFEMEYWNNDRSVLVLPISKNAEKK